MKTKTQPNDNSSRYDTTWTLQAWSHDGKLIVNETLKGVSHPTAAIVEGYALLDSRHSNQWATGLVSDTHGSIRL